MTIELTTKEMTVIVQALKAVKFRGDLEAADRAEEVLEKIGLKLLEL